ncbi:MAG: DUF924 domain-containing protein [Proteobacteria bacterium]|nr:DUF924 domain-containing protein [Pseudomonadota bacterium]
MSPNSETSAARISEIVDFWLNDCLDSPEATFARRDWWYKGGVSVDAEIQTRFGALVAEASTGGLLDWRETSNGNLALILLLDQFTRNIHRNTINAYSGDPLAMEIVTQAIERKLDRELHPVCQIWLYHPFHHAERIDDQDRGLALLAAIKDGAAPAWQPYIQRSITGWTRHRDIVARFGRFPHRNAVLARQTTAQEREFLEKDGESFGQGVKLPQTP